MLSDPILESLLTAELAAGNTIVRTQMDYFCRTTIHLSAPFHQDYRASASLPGVRFSESNHPHEWEHYSMYESEAAALSAPYQPRERGARRPAVSEPPPWDPPSPVQLARRLRRLADAIEAELKRMGAWADAPPAPELFQFRRPFAGDTMAFEQWIQFVLLPRLRPVESEKPNWPKTSNVGAYAVREFDGREDTDGLVHLLRILDAQFQQPAYSSAGPSLRITAAGALAFIVVLVGSLLWLGVIIGISTPLVRLITPRDLPANLSALYSFHKAGPGWFGSVLVQARESAGGVVTDHKLTLNLFPKHRALVIERRGGQLTTRSLNSNGRSPLGAATFAGVLDPVDTQGLLLLLETLAAARSRQDLMSAAHAAVPFRIRDTVAISTSPGSLPGPIIASLFIFLFLLPICGVFLLWQRYRRRRAAR